MFSKYGKTVNISLFFILAVFVAHNVRAQFFVANEFLLWLGFYAFTFIGQQYKIKIKAECVVVCGLHIFACVLLDTFMRKRK